MSYAKKPNSPQFPTRCLSSRGALIDEQKVRRALDRTADRLGFADVERPLECGYEFPIGDHNRLDPG